MQTTILWRGLEYSSLENCLLTVGGDVITANAAISGSYRDKKYRITYTIMASPQWEVLSFALDSQINGREENIAFEGDGKGNWKTGGNAADQFAGCIDIDISLTPFTNTLPILRLNLAVKQAKEIQVLYLDVLNGKIKPVRQKYTRVSGDKYLYENIPNDFEALITVDEQGLVVDYPGLFTGKGFIRTAESGGE